MPGGLGAPRLLLLLLQLCRHAARQRTLKLPGTTHCKVTAADPPKRDVGRLWWQCLCVWCIVLLPIHTCCLVVVRLLVLLMLMLMLVVVLRLLLLLLLRMAPIVRWSAAVGAVVLGVLLLLLLLLVAHPACSAAAFKPRGNIIIVVFIVGRGRPIHGCVLAWVVCLLVQ